MARLRTAQTLLLIDALGALVVVVSPTAIAARNWELVKNHRISDVILTTELFLREEWDVTVPFVLDSPRSVMVLRGTSPLIITETFNLVLILPL